MQLIHINSLLTIVSFVSNQIGDAYIVPQEIGYCCVGRTLLYNPLMLFYAISPSLSGDKANKKSIGLSVASDIKDNEITRETIPQSSSKKEEKGETDDDGQRN
jgi:hypothetical protein